MRTTVYCEALDTAPTKRDGFTLIELLVVIAVIAILAALLLPSLSRAKEEGYITKCMSNLHQLTLAISMYTQDTGTYPYSEVWPGGWPAELQPYLKSPFPEPNFSYSVDGNATTYLGPRESIWACPTYNRVQGAFYLAGEEWSDNRGAYGYNASGLGLVQGVDYFGSQSLGLGGLIPSDGRAPPTHESQVVSPSDMIGIGDAFITENPLGGHTFLEEVFDYPFYYDPEVKGLPPGNPAIQAMQQRHWGKFNIGFCDAHVESLRTNDLVNLNNSAVAARWNNDHQPHNQNGFVLQ